MEIKRLFKKKIGGIEQWISIRTRDDSKPILLIIHGAPGVPCMTLFRKYNYVLEDYFIVVTWDQRGTGRSYCKDITGDDITIECLVQDAHELTRYLKSRLKRDKIFVLGHSWGATMALHLVHKYSKDYYACFLVSPLVNTKKNEEVSYEFTLGKGVEGGDGYTQSRLKKMGRPVNGCYRRGLKSMILQKAFVFKYKGFMYKKSTMLRLLLTVFGSKEYGYKHLVNTIRGFFFSLNNLHACIKEIDCFGQIPRSSIPVHFFAGVHDYITPYSILLEYFEGLDAPVKKLYKFDQSAHNPMWEEAYLFHEKIIGIVKGYKSLGHDTKI